MSALVGFAKERVGSLVSKKLGVAAAGSVVAVGAGEVGMAVGIQIAYIVVQAALDGWKYWCDAKYGRA